MKKIIIPALITTALAATGAVAYYQTTPEVEPIAVQSVNNADSIKRAVFEVKSDYIEPVAEPIAEPAETVVVETLPEPIEEPIVIETKTTQEYAAQYLDLSGVSQQCFDMIVDKYPERFTESVREQNIRSLTIFASTCSTGIMSNNNILDIGTNDKGELYYKHGAWFDSALARKQ